MKISDSEKLGLKDELQRVVQHVGRFRELEITASARDLFQNWYMKMEISTHTKRLDGYATRLMSLLAVNDLENEVDEVTVQTAISLCDRQLEVRKTYDPIDADDKIAKMEE